MRLPATLFLVLTLCAVAAAGPTPEESKDVAKIEKAGADVTVDDSLPEAARLRVTFRTLDDRSAAALRGMKRIATLTVEDGAGMTDRTFAVLGTLTNLRELSIYKPAMTNAGMSHLKNLKELRKLYLIDARVSDSGVAALKGHGTLEELDLSGSAITNGAGTTFKTLSSLRLLAVSKTKFGDSGVMTLKELAELKKLEAVAANVSEKGARALEEAIKGVRVRR